MKDSIKLIIAWLCKVPILRALPLGIVFRNTFFLSKFSGLRGNYFESNGASFDRVEVRVAGRGNSIHIQGARIGRCSVRIEGDDNWVKIADGVDLYGSKLVLRGSGNHVSIGSGSTFGGVRLVCSGVGIGIDIGERCMFSDGIEVWASDTHAIFGVDGRRLNDDQSISIGDDVWIGCRVAILKGVNVSSGSVIGMASVVTRDTPPNSLSAGNPSKVIREQVRWQK